MMNLNYVIIIQRSYDYTKIKEYYVQPPKNIPVNKIATDPTPAMPDECKIPGDVIGSYRKYYVMKKREFATWKAPAVIPEWYKNGVKDGEKQI